MKLPVAVQLFSLRNEAAEDLRGTLAKVKEMGYDGVELAGLYEREPEEIRAMCEAAGLIPISAHVGMERILRKPYFAFEPYVRVGCKYVVIPYSPLENFPHSPNYKYAKRNIATCVEAAQDLGLKVLYHNHKHEFVKHGGKYLLDEFLCDFPDIATEFDVAWVDASGDDPVRRIRDYKGRVPIVHLKDYYGEKGEEYYALIALDDHGEPPSPKGREYRPLGQGIVDIPAVVKAAEESGAEWFVVEQDDATPGMTPLECAEASIKYLKSL